jgi:hypothetical protein
MGSSHFPTYLSHQFCSKLFQFSENCEKFTHYSVKPSAHELGLESMPSAAPYTLVCSSSHKLKEAIYIRLQRSVPRFSLPV